MSRIGHYAIEIIAAILSWVVLSIWVPMPFVVRVIMSIILVVILLTSFVGMLKHNRGWCRGCVTPLHPNKAAERHARSLRLVHLPRVYTVSYIVVGLAVTGLVLITNALLVLMMWSAFQLTLIYVVRANVLHHRLAPWCPSCHEGGPGKVDYPEPLPVDGLYV